MADGYSQFPQPTSQRFYLQQRLGQRAASPRNNDTPSPSQSPAPQSPGNLANFYQQQSHPGLMMHGSSGGPAQQRFALPNNVNYKMQQAQQQHHQQMDHQMNHMQQGGHNNGGHNVNYQTSNMQSQAYTPHNVNGAVNSQNGPHWQEQLTLAQTSRAANSPHHHARSAAAMTRGPIPGTSTNISQPSLTTSGGTTYPAKNKEPEKKEYRDKAGKVIRQDWTAIDLGGQGLRALAAPIFNYTFLDKLYINNNKITKLPSAIGKLKRLTHLDASGNSLTELPPEIGMLTSLKTLLLFDNNLSTLPYEMGTLYQLDMLGIEGNPLHEDLKGIMMKAGTRSLIVHLRENAPVPEAPVGRDWIIVNEGTERSEPDKPDPNKLLVLCYNILCDKYATQQMYGYTPSWVLEWDYRKAIILNEILDRNADIVCLQEIDLDNFEEYFSVQLAYQDYRGVFWPKGRAKTMSDSERKTVDGCATFYKADKYNLIEKRVIDFSASAIQREDMKQTADIFNRVMPKDNIAVVTYLENKATGYRIIVTNVHIFWDPAFKDVKLVQVAILMEELAKVADQFARTNARPANPDPATPNLTYSSGTQIPMLICIDSNSDGDSGVYELLARGNLTSDHNDLDGRTYGNFTKDGMSHPFSLKSSYQHIGELAFTNYTPNFTGVIDYIWYATNSMEVTALLGDVDKEYMEKVPGFPNYHFPSDHISLLSEFKIKPRKENKPTVVPDFGPSSSSRK